MTNTSETVKTVPGKDDCEWLKKQYALYNGENGFRAKLEMLKPSYNPTEVELVCAKLSVWLEDMLKHPAELGNKDSKLYQDLQNALRVTQYILSGERQQLEYPLLVENIIQCLY
ncbi:MAG: hypothetical protein ABIJ03_00235 [Patescibacteria group bacterium]|nr:hypothetical protein [Patescibacteria group bacterium]